MGSQTTSNAKVAAAPAVQGVVPWLTYLALLTLPLGVLIAGRQAMRARPMLGTVAAVVAWVGFTSLFASVAIGDYLAQAAPTTGTPNSTTAALLDAINALPATAAASIVFVVGHILGGILLGIALWRAVPAWAAVALAISQPLHLVFAVVIPNHVLDSVAWALPPASRRGASISSPTSALLTTSEIAPYRSPTWPIPARSRPMLDRVLRLLAAHGVFQRQDGGYENTVSSRLLRADHLMSMGAFSQMIGHRQHRLHGRSARLSRWATTTPANTL